VLVEQGVSKILVFSTHLSAKSIHSEIDVPKSVQSAELPSNMLIEYVGHYGDHPLAIQAMAEKILPYL
jgi:protoheme ferro-lyase